MGQYNKKGLYTGYDKNHKERDALDFYSTPTEEVTNILDELWLPFKNNDVILEPCAGGGHMIQGILDHLNKIPFGLQPKIIATDVQKRENITNVPIECGLQYDFLSDDYPYTENIDWIIMNPPFATIEPFTMKALTIAKKGVVMLGRLQFLEGQSRFENIFDKHPPDDIYVYVDRIACYKNGDLKQKMASAQAYAWFVFYTDAKADYQGTFVNWLRRKDKQKFDKIYKKWYN